MSGTRIPLIQAQRLADRIRAALEPFCLRCEIAGSIRRQRPFVGDIDLVVLPKPGERDSMIARCACNALPLKSGDQYAVFGLKGSESVQLDLWIAHDRIETPPDLLGAGGKVDPCNFGVLLLARTGSAQHNVFIAQTATAAGLHFNPHRGIERRRGGEVIASAEEQDIFDALQMEWIAPERRERF